MTYKIETQNSKELDQFLEFIREKKINLYLEIGLYSGSTFKAVYDTLLEVWKGDTTKFRVLGIDMPTNPEAFKVAQETVSQMPGATIWWTSSTDVQTVEEVLGEVTHWYSRFDDENTTHANLTRKWLPGEPRSLVFIDGDHLFEQAKQDYLAYGSHFEYVAFNDISPRTIPQNRKKHPSIGSRDVATVYHLYEGIKAGNPDMCETYFEDYEAAKARGIGVLY